MKRICPEGILPLELWDLRVADGILWDHMRSADFGRVLREGLVRLRQGTAATRSEGLLPALRFDAVLLSGGGATAVVQELRKGPWSAVHVSGDPDFAGEAGGLALLKEHHLTGWVMDLGQSSLKIGAGGLRRIWQRDLSRLPIRGGTVDPVLETRQRSELRNFIAGALMDCRQYLTDFPDDERDRFPLANPFMGVHSPPVRPDRPEVDPCRREGSGPPLTDAPAGIVCALPSRLDDLGNPEGSSYIGMKDDISLLPDGLALAGLHRTAILTLNDAELAAVSARLHPLVRPPTLVLTIGFGVGAALISRP